MSVTKSQAHGSSKTILEFFSLGVVAEDKLENDWEIDIYPIEILPNVSGKPMEDDEISGSVTDSNDGNYSVSTQRKKIIRARWLPIFGWGNLVTPPCVRKGEEVLILNFGGTPEYYWTLVKLDMNLRKREKWTMFMTNRENIGETKFDEAYYLSWDTYNKFIKWHTSNNDGEFTTYDYLLDTKNGAMEFIDGMNNFFFWDTQKMFYHYHTDQMNGEFCLYDWKLNTADGFMSFEDSMLNKYLWDTQNKLFHFHSDVSNGEFCTYDRKLNTADGVLDFFDGKGNTFKWDTQNSLFHLHTDTQCGGVTTYDVKIDAAGGILTIVDGNGNHLTLDSNANDWTLKAMNNITIDAANDIIVKAGNNINVTAGNDKTSSAGNNISDTAGSNISGSAGGNVDISAGGSGNITAGGVMSIKGNPLNLN